MAASTLNLFEVLVERAHLEPQDAAVVAEAIRNSLIAADLVTKSYLDAQLAVTKSHLEAQLAATRSHLEAQLAATKSYLDAQLAKFKAEIKAEIKGEMLQMKGEILRHLYAALLAQFGVLTAMTYFIATHVK